ncbi:MAG: hypothetical protein Q8O19_07235 [Rectinemataceae bacterium]|nr:hypothetical protein [Rectinemataceae bacterium]
MAKVQHEETLRQAFEALIGEVLCVQWLDSGADHKFDSLAEMRDAELCTQRTIGELAKVDDESILLVHSIANDDTAEGTQIALNCIMDVDIYKKDTDDEK